MKCILVACLALVAVASVSGTSISSDEDLVVNVCGYYYSSFGLSLNGVLNAVGGLLKELLSIVGIVVNNLLGLVGGLLNTLLGGLLGGGGNQTISLDQFLTAPKNKGQYLDYLLRLVISYQAVIDKACPGLGRVWIRAIYICITVTVSADSKTYSGSKLFKPLRGNLSDWLRVLKYDQCQKDFNAVLIKNGGWSSLSGGKKVIFHAVRDILGGLSAALSDGVEAVGGLVVLAAGLVKIAIRSVGIIIYLLANLLDDVGDVLDDLLQAIFGIVGSIQIIGDADIDECKTEIVNTCGAYTSSHYSAVFSVQV